MFKSIKYIIGLLCISLTCFGQTNKSISLTWQPSPSSDVIGYKLYYPNNQHTISIDVKNVLYYTIDSLSKDNNYWFYATAYTSNQVESVPSNIVNYNPTNIYPSFNLTNNIILTSPISRFITFYLRDNDSHFSTLGIKVNTYSSNLLDKVQIIPFLAFGYTNKILWVTPNIINTGTGYISFVLNDEIINVTNIINIKVTNKVK